MDRETIYENIIKMIEEKTLHGISVCILGGLKLYESDEIEAIVLHLDRECVAGAVIFDDGCMIDIMGITDNDIMITTSSFIEYLIGENLPEWVEYYNKKYPDGGIQKYYLPKTGERVSIILDTYINAQVIP